MKWPLPATPIPVLASLEPRKEHHGGQRAGVHARLAGGHCNHPRPWLVTDLPPPCVQRVCYQLTDDFLDELVKGEVTKKALEQIDFRDDRFRLQSLQGLHVIGQANPKARLAVIEFHLENNELTSLIELAEYKGEPMFINVRPRACGAAAQSADARMHARLRCAPGATNIRVAQLYQRHLRHTSEPHAQRVAGAAGAAA